ncbi:uncharacterized protein LOC143239301 [Tachypleus tridentatus]|uniref:uncharacterized protein LOC143239301 n=1 Tax=Tachypleus tridentatus TaxID=6853 RepID=UPI003FD3AA3D
MATVNLEDKSRSEENLKQVKEKENKSNISTCSANCEKKEGNSKAKRSSENSEILQKRLNEFEKLFADRYTESDEDFMKLKSQPLPDPPCVHPWEAEPVREYQDRYHGRNRWRESERNHYRHHERSYSGSRNPREGMRDDYRSREPHGRRYRDSEDWGRYDNRRRDRRW